MKVGWSFASDSQGDEGGFGTGLALEDSEWGSDRGRKFLQGVDPRVLRLWSRGNPDAAVLGEKAGASSRAGWIVQALNEPNLSDLGGAANVEQFRGGPTVWNQWLRACLATGGRYSIWLTPLSPFDPLSIWRWYAALDRDLLGPDEGVGGILAHAYGSRADVERAMGPVLDLARETGLPIVVSELGPRGDQSTEDWEDDLPGALYLLASYGVVAAHVFAPHWPVADPGQQPRQMVGTRIEEIMRGWNG